MSFAGEGPVGDVPGFHAVEGLELPDELARRLIGAMREGVLVCDRDGRLILANDRAIEITGIAFSELAATAARVGEGAGEPDGAPQTEGTPGRAVWEQLLARLRDDPAHLHGQRVEGAARRADGSEFPFEAEINSLEAGQRQFFVTFVHDITDRKAAERRLADARDVALRASVVKSEFLATMSHEIRTPMNGVIGSLDLMLDSELAPELAELAQIARTAANDLLAIIDDILDLSKIEADKVQSRHEPFDLVAIVEGVADIVAVTVRRKGVALATYVDLEIPPVVRGDARLLRQVLVNLVGNAAKFTDRGEIVIRAERQAAPESQALVRFSVRDTGAGIPADAVATLFEPFTQVDDGSSQELGGSGLGLAISSRLVRLMGGRLSVETELGRGSNFSFELPLELPEEVVERVPPPGLGRPLRVLVIDGSDTSADTIERYLRAWGMVTTRRADAESGLERFAAAPPTERFDVVIAAASALDGDARALARELRGRAGEDPVFLIALVDIGERLREADSTATPIFDAVVGRPIKQSRLYDALAGVQSELGPHGHAEAPDADGDFRGLRVLIAEDNPVNQEVLLRQVQRLGLVADAVNNGQEALDALGAGNYDAVLMDCQMPVMDGYTAAQAIRSAERAGEPRLPIVAVTANAMSDDFDRCRAAGMDDFVAKPVTLAALAGAIARSVGANRPARPAPDGGAFPQGDGGVAGAAGPAPVGAPDGGRADAPPTDSAAPPTDEAAAAPAVASTASGALDRPALDSLQEDLGGPAALLRIVRLFLEQLDGQAEQIERDASSGELETLARNAHRMKSSAATLGAIELSELLAQLETTAGERDVAAVDGLTARFMAAVALAREAFEAVVEELDA
jgi:two-component system, sensor histidine kinase and response regulator